MYRVNIFSMHTYLCDLKQNYVVYIGAQIANATVKLDLKIIFEHCQCMYSNTNKTRLGSPHC